MEKAIKHLIDQYTRYIGNIQYHIDKNSPSEHELAICKQRIRDFNEFIYDLNRMIS